MTNLQRIRKERGLSQRELAELSGVNLRMIQKYENGEKNINHAQAITVIKLAYALNTKAIILLEIDEKEKGMIITKRNKLNKLIEEKKKAELQKAGVDLKAIGKQLKDGFNSGITKKKS